MKLLAVPACVVSLLLLYPAHTFSQAGKQKDEPTPRRPTAQGTPAPSQNPTPAPSPEKEAEGEVDLLLKDLRAAGKMVLAPCPEEGCKAEEREGVEGRIITGGVINGKALSKPQPEYPSIAKAARVSGAVVVRVVVDEEGKVIGAQPHSGHPLLHLAAVRAAREWRFEPTLLDGKPALVTGTLTFNFNLQ